MSKRRKKKGGKKKKKKIKEDLGISKKRCKICSVNHSKYERYHICKSCKSYCVGQILSLLISEDYVTEDSIICPRCDIPLNMNYLRSVNDTSVQYLLKDIQIKHDMTEITGESTRKSEKKKKKKKKKKSKKKKPKSDDDDFDDGDDDDDFGDDDDFSSDDDDSKKKKKKSKKKKKKNSKKKKKKEETIVFDDEDDKLVEKIAQIREMEKLGKTEQDCVQCVNTAFCYKTPCGHYVCEECLAQTLTATKKDEGVKCFGGCKSILDKKWLLSCRGENVQMVMNTLHIDKSEDWMRCKLCETMLKIAEADDGYEGMDLQCYNCNVSICRFCQEKWTPDETGSCTQPSCPTKFNPLKQLDVTPEMQSFKFNNGPKNIYRARLCVWCGNVNYRQDGKECKHITCSACKKKYCHVCLRKFDYKTSKWPCNTAWSFCPGGIAPKQTKVPVKSV